MSGHTPGPWVLSQEDPALIYIPHTTDPFRMYAISEHSDYRDEEDEANARLIAAAPELLAAAEKVIACGALPRERHLCEAINELKAAVKKAKGE